MQCSDYNSIKNLSNYHYENEINEGLNNEKNKFRLLFSRRFQKYPFLSSIPYIAPRLFINDKRVFTFKNCEDIGFDLDRGIYKIDILTLLGKGGVHFYIEIKEDTKSEFYFEFYNGLIPKITFFK